MDLSSEIYHALLPAFITVALGLPVLALGAIDGIAEATASFAKLASGRLSDRSGKSASPGCCSATASPRLSKPLFPIAQGALELMGARFADRVGKGIRGAPARRDHRRRDSAGNPWPRFWPAPGARYGRSADCAARRGRADVPARRGHPRRLLDRGDPRGTVVPARAGGREGAGASLRRARRSSHSSAASAISTRPTRRLLAVAFLFSLARFSEGFLILRALDVGVSRDAFTACARRLQSRLPRPRLSRRRSLSDRMSPRSILMAGMGILIAANLLLAQDIGIAWAGRSASCSGARTWR